MVLSHLAVLSETDVRQDPTLGAYISAVYISSLSLLQEIIYLFGNP